MRFRILTLIAFLMAAAPVSAWPARRVQSDVRFDSRGGGDVRFDTQGGNLRFDMRGGFGDDVRFDTRGNGNVRFDSRGGGDVRFDVQQRAPARGSLARLLLGGGCR